MKIIGSIEARMGSTRLPGKTMMPVYKDMPLLECVVRRFQLCRNIDDVVVATTVGAKDTPIAAWCAANGVKCFRGSEEDVLSRVAGAARENKADAIAQMGADSAYLDFNLVDKLVDIYKAGQYDYVCNDLKLTYPLGIYSHIVRVSTLAELDKRTDLSAKDRVDVVRNIFEHPEKYRLHNIEAQPPYDQPQLRLTIDYPQDMEQAREIYSIFGGHEFTTEDLLALHRDRPEVFARTRDLVQESGGHLPKK